MAKGASNQAKVQLGMTRDAANTYGTSAAGVNSELSPFLHNELNNPQGYGQQTESQMLTQGGQAVSGATGSADEAARLAASRTGNPAAVAGVIDSTGRNAMKQNSNNALNIADQNAQLKIQQQQDAAKQLQGLYGTDVGASLNALGLGNQSIGEWTAADKSNPWAGVGPTLTERWLSPFGGAGGGSPVQGG